MSERVAFFYARARLSIRSARVAGFPAMRDFYIRLAREWRDLARQTRARA